MFNLEIKNTGRSPASNLNLSMDKNFFRCGSNLEEANIRNYNAFTHEIATFSPNEALTFDLTQGFNMDNTQNGANLTPKKFTVTAKYDFLKKKYNDTFTIDTEPYMNMTTVKTISEHIGKIGNFFCYCISNHHYYITFCSKNYQACNI